MAMPEIALPSRRLIMVILGGIVSFLFAVGVLFLMFYFDHSINNAQELANSTQQPVLGTLSIMRAATLDHGRDISAIFGNADTNCKRKLSKT
jgi:flagellar basal body-associated protein FliL